MAWLEGFDRAPIKNRPGWTYVEGRFKIVLHSTESDPGSIGGVENWYAQKGGVPHLTVDIDRKVRRQHIDTDLACYALRNAAGGVHTNGARSINIEIVGRAHELPGRPVEQFEWLGREVIAPIVRAHPSIDPTVYPEFPPSSQAYGAATRWRMERLAWRDFGGICGHSHVPEGNTHSDPGNIPIDVVSRAAVAAVAPPPKPKQPGAGGSTVWPGPIRPGAKGAHVGLLQTWAKEAAGYVGRVDNDYGPGTLRAVVAGQAALWVLPGEPVGVVGEWLWNSFRDGLFKTGAPGGAYGAALRAWDARQ